MKFTLGPMPQDASFAPETSAAWVKSREPGPWAFQLMIALPVGTAVFLLVGFLWSLVVPGGGLPSRDTVFRAAVWSLLLFPIIVPVHELVHALVHPKWGRSAQSSFGFWPRTLLFYAHYSGEWTRRRFVACLLAPFLVLSIGPLVWSWIFGAKYGLVIVVSLLNAAASYGDLGGAAVVLAHVPRGAVVRNQGYYTWWRN